MIPELGADELARVRERVATSRLPPAVPGSGWTFGCDGDHLEGFRRYWLDGFDDGAALARLGRFTQRVVEVDGARVHVVQQQGEGDVRRPLVLAHGWPSSYTEFLDVVEPLAFPSRFGGDPADAFDVIVPSLPGFGASTHPPGRIIGPRATARLWDRVLTEELGLDRYLVHGGDLGAFVASWLGHDAPARTRAIHVTMLVFRSTTLAVDADDEAWEAVSAATRAERSAYVALQMTKPQSLAWAAADNPLGQAAWVLERFHDWSDLRERSFDDVHDRDRLLDNILTYVTGDRFTTALWFYAAMRAEGGLPFDVRCPVPTAYTQYPADGVLPPPPRRRIEATYELVRYRAAPTGGHFPALEVPDWFVADLREWGRQAW